MAFLFILPTWPVDIWSRAMRKAAPQLDVRVWPDGVGRVEDIEYTAAWLPPPDVVRSLPNLKVIFSLGAGVDAILKDPTLPKDIPIVRVNEPDLTARMTEYVVRMCCCITASNAASTRTRSARLGPLPPCGVRHGGRHHGAGRWSESAERLRDLGFKVAGCRTRKRIDGVHCHAGAAEFDPSRRTGYSRLPAAGNARDRRHHQSRHDPQAVAKPFGAPIIINMAAGGSRSRPNSCLPRCGRAPCGDTRCLSNRASARREPIVEPSESDGDAA
jgi:hypothetical protein